LEGQRTAEGAAGAADQHAPAVFRAGRGILQANFVPFKGL